MNYSVIINLTQHKSTQEQQNQGVIDLPNEYAEELKKTLTFDELPSKNEIIERVEKIYDLVLKFVLDKNSPIKEEVSVMLSNGKLNEDEFKKLNIGFMIGGALWIIKPLIEKLSKIGTPLFAFSKRETKEINDGNEVKKISVFKHIGFIEAI